LDLGEGNSGPQFLRALLSLVLVAALLFLVAWLTEAHSELGKVDFFLLASAATFFLLSVFVWIVSWAFLIRKRHGIPYPKMLAIGFSSVYGSITPVQIGAEALRSIRLKRLFGVSLTESVSSAMAVKGLKFASLSLSASVLIALFLLGREIDAILLVPLLSGFFVVLIAAFLFLLPINKRFGEKISSFFLSFRAIPGFSLLGKYFSSYSDYLAEISKNAFLWIFFLSFSSWVLEFLAFYFVFLSLNLFLPLASLAVLFVLLAVVERTPFLPRGILLFEIAGFAFLSMSHLVQTELSVGEIGSVIVLLDFVRLVVPVFLSVLFYAVFKARGIKNSRKSSSLQQVSR